LWDKGIWPNSKDSLLNPPSSSDLDAFLRNPQGTIDVRKPMIHWAGQWDDPWNDFTVLALAKEWIQLVQENKVEYITYHRTMTTTSISRLMKTKLGHFRRRWDKECKHTTEELTAIGDKSSRCA
jgi:hypothetical protein